MRGLHGPIDPDSGSLDGSEGVPRAEPPSNDYDLLPYISMPVVFSQPARLAALSVLHGLPTADAECAHVLELGCASGGNIIPLAARYPKAQFLGLDLSRKHVETGCRRIAALGLRNITIRQADITDVRLSGGRFDYIVCHGVFSWFPHAVQDAIFAICRQYLTDTGIAVISYNVLPGWHLRNVVRSICVRHAGSEGSPLQRVARARTILDEVARAADAADPYGHVVRSEAARIARQPASYILGEFLAQDNAPCSFRTFADRAAQFDLAWLCEADLPSSIPETFAPKAAARIRALAGDDPLGLQEYIDMFSGRTFRRSVLVRSAHALGQVQPGQDKLETLHVASALTLDSDRSTDRASAFTDHRGRYIEVRQPAVRRALIRLAERYPATSTLPELAAESSQAADQQSVSKAVFRLLTSGRAIASTLPLVCGKANVALPRAWPIAQAEAAERQPWVTSLRHTAVILSPVLSLLVSRLDGRHDRTMLGEHLIAAHHAGTIDLLGEQVVAPDARTDTPLETVAASHVDRGLNYLAANALLLPD